MKKLLALALTLVMAMSVFVGCATAESTVPETTEEVTETVEETVPNDLKSDVYTNVFSDDRDVENVFDIMNNENVKAFQADYSSYEKYKELLDDLEEMGFKELLLYQHTKKDSIRIGKVGDVIVGQFEVREDPIVWNFRAEKADGFTNNTGLVFPANTETQEFPKGIVGAKELLTAWAMDDAETMWINIWMVFFPKSGNLYTFYAENLTSGSITRCPDVVVQTFKDTKRDDEWIYIDKNGNTFR